MAMTNGNEIMFLDFSDDEHTRSERDLQIESLIDQNRELAREMAGKSASLSDYVLAFRFDFLYSNFRGLAWMDELPSPDDFKSEFSNEKFIERARSVAEKISKMKQDLDNAPDKEGYAKMIIRQIKDKDSPWGLRVLAKFPAGTVVPHAGFDRKASEFNNGEQIVYYEPNLACFKNAYDDARKVANENVDDEHQVYYLKIVDVEEASSLIVHGSNGVAEYQLGIDDNGEKIKQNMDAYIMVSLLGRAAEEEYRIRVSDFWKKVGQ